uniref:30S ribosomal protein S11 n=1 Tax=Noccaea caerulescens TaxID=107243 RepID=A0A1J3INH1_NOCCA
MNGLSRHLRASSFLSLIRSYGGINSIYRFSSQSDGFSVSGGRSGDQEPNAEEGASPMKTFSEMKAGILNKIGNGGGYSVAPNAPPPFKTATRPRFPNTLPDQFSQMNPGLPDTGGGSGFSAPSSYQNFTKSSLLKDSFRSGQRGPKDLDFVREVIEGDEGRNAGLSFHFHRPNLETNADIIHIKMLRNNTFVTVTDSKGNVKCKATSGSLPDLKGGRKMTNYTADATAENIGRRAKAMGLKSVVVKVNGFTHFKKKRKAIVAFRDGFTNSRSDQNPIVYIEDTTRKAHNGCRLPRKRRV